LKSDPVEIKFISAQNCPEYIDIKLPPEGLLIKELTITAINFLTLVAEHTGYQINIIRIGDKIKICSTNLVKILREAASTASKLMDLKMRPNVRWPRLHTNDKGTLKKSKIVGSIISNIETYGDLAKVFIKDLSNLANSTLNVYVERNKISLLGGGGRFSMLQLFKTELYENALTFQEPYNRDLSIEIDDKWLTLILLGYALSHINYSGASLELMSTYDLYSGSIVKIYLSMNILNILENLTTQPMIVSIIQNHILIRRLLTNEYRKFIESELLMKYNLREEFSTLFKVDEGILSDLMRRPPIIRIHRIGFEGRTFTEISREDIVINDALLRFLMDLDDDCVERFFRLSRRALNADDPKIVNMLTYIYEAINKAKDPAFVSYYVARTIAEEESYQRIITSRCISSIIKGLTGWKL